MFIRQAAGAAVRARSSCHSSSSSSQNLYCLARKTLFHSDRHTYRGTDSGSDSDSAVCGCCGLVNHSSFSSSSLLLSSARSSVSTPSSSFPSPSPSQLLQQQQHMMSRRRFTSLSCEETDGHPHIENLVANNKRWVADSIHKDPDFLSKLSAPQKPRYLYIGCSDSRVPANEILGLGPGEVFVHRNIGNQVPGNDLNVLSVLEFAIGHLNIQDIVVTGHYDCGAIQAACARQDLGTLENWLRLIRDVHRLHKDTLDHIGDGESRQKALVELNVVEQCLNVYKTGIVQRKRNQSRQAMIDAGIDPRKHREEIFPRIHGMVFNPSDGRLKYIPVDVKKRVGSLEHIYGLY